MPKGKKSRSVRLIVDKRYFQDQLRLHGITQTKLAELLGFKNRGSISQLFDGSRKMQLDEASELARILGLPIEDIMRAAGLSVEGIRSKKDTVEVAGHIDAAGIIHFGAEGLKGQRKAPLPAFGAPGPNKLKALRYQTGGTQMDAMNGGLVYYQPSTTLILEDIGRLSVIVARGEPNKGILGVIRRGNGGSRFDIYSIAGGSIRENVAVESASQVVWIKI